MKWTGTVMYLIGMLLTAANVYPVNLVFGAIGGGIWAMVGMQSQDRALITVELASCGIYTAGLLHWSETKFHTFSSILAYYGISHY